LLRTKERGEIPPMDSEIFNESIHMESLREVTGERADPQAEFLAFGMSKGSMVLVNINKINQIYLRLTLHRAAVVKILYLENTNKFLTLCADNFLSVSYVDRELKKALKLYSIRVQKSISFWLPMAESLAFEGPMLTDLLLFGFLSGEVEVFEVSSNPG